MKKNNKPRKMLIPSEYFTKSTGGNNRQWTKRYRAMYDKLAVLRELDDGSDKMKHLIRGFEMCVETFYNYKKLNQLAEKFKEARE